MSNDRAFKLSDILRKISPSLCTNFDFWFTPENEKSKFWISSSAKIEYIEDTIDIDIDCIQILYNVSPDKTLVEFCHPDHINFILSSKKMEIIKFHKHGK